MLQRWLVKGEMHLFLKGLNTKRGTYKYLQRMGNSLGKETGRKPKYLTRMGKRENGTKYWTGQDKRENKGKYLTRMGKREAENPKYLTKIVKREATWPKYLTQMG